MPMFSLFGSTRKIHVEITWTDISEKRDYNSVQCKVHNTLNTQSTRTTLY
jgi:hypothetical protein